MIETSTFAVSEGISLLYTLVLWSERLLEYFIFFREARKPRLLYLAVVEYILVHTYCILNWSPLGKQKKVSVSFYHQNMNRIPRNQKLYSFYVSKWFRKESIEDLDIQARKLTVNKYDWFLTLLVRHHSKHINSNQITIY